MNWSEFFRTGSAIVSAVATVSIAGLGLQIARQQVTIAKRKLRLDLYPLRRKVYEDAHLAVVSAVTFGPGSLIFDKATESFRDSLRDARFLFGADAFDYLNDLLTNILQFRHAVSLALRDENYHGSEHLAGFRKGHARNQAFILSSLQDLWKTLGPYLKVEDDISISLNSVPDPGQKVAENEIS